MGLLEEAQATANRIGYASREQLGLQQDAVVMVAIQDGHLPELDPSLAGFENLLADEGRFLVGILGGDDQRQQAVGPGRLELLGKPHLVAGDRSLGQRDDLGGRTVIDAELEQLRSGMPVGEAEDIVVVGPAKPVDRLGVVADRREIARAGRRDRLDDLDLNGVGVLHFVDQHMVKLASLGGPLVGEFADQPAPLQQQVVIVHGIGVALSLGVCRGGGLDPRLPLEQPRGSVRRSARAGDG